MSPWVKFGCFITGWNRNILANCTEASHKALKKYTSSMLILILLWAFTGYCFADRYVGLQWWGCIIVALVFVIIVVQIERQIILTVVKNYWVVALRVLLAFIMAILGSTIIDQIIFGDDVDKEMIDIRTEEVNRIAPARQIVIQAEIDRLSFAIDSLDKVNMQLNEEIAQRPTIMTVQSVTTEVPVVQKDGSIVKEKSNSITRTPIENPRLKQVISNEKNLEYMRKLLDEYNNKKLNVAAELKKELEAKTGFLEELKALVRIMSKSSIALGFYMFMFSFLLILELLVVICKLGDKSCDYDLIVQHQLAVKEESIRDLVKRV
ncbi:DUF4407 domain-containing protein [Macellibacteroides fermentans]|uniref:DUF4407 domain-containing protein n=1 Tax=Macellibacteroides fermentans TaxID=879969 RepID=A0A8E1ZYL6_9PORP|nr:DUF4407 domain-containing protein [Macellibacteroides fermentans]NYI48298.1 hypothetical protein [Macellibacteroides fermentans]